MPWGPCGREERSRRGGGVCRPGVRWERGAWAAGRDSGRDTTLELHQPAPMQPPGYVLLIFTTEFCFSFQSKITLTLQKMTVLIYLETAGHWSECSFGRLWFWEGESPAPLTPLTCLNQTHTHIFTNSAVFLRLHNHPTPPHPSTTF